MFSSVWLFSTLPSHFLHDSKHCPVSAATNRVVQVCGRLQNSVWVCELAEESWCLEQSGGKVSLSRCPLLFGSP